MWVFFLIMLVIGVYGINNQYQLGFYLHLITGADEIFLKLNYKVLFIFLCFVAVKVYSFFFSQVIFYSLYTLSEWFSLVSSQAFVELIKIFRL